MSAAVIIMIPVLVMSAAVPMASAMPIVNIIGVETAGQHRRKKENSQENQQGFPHFLAPIVLFCKTRRASFFRLLPETRGGREYSTREGERVKKRKGLGPRAPFRGSPLLAPPLAIVGLDCPAGLAFVPPPLRRVGGGV